eukprot:Awhi_evm1s7443
MIIDLSVVESTAVKAVTSFIAEVLELELEASGGIFFPGWNLFSSGWNLFSSGSSTTGLLTVLSL